MKIALVTLVLMTLFTTQNAAASDTSGTKFRCSNVGGNEEWVISVDLEKHKAAFFDNDATVVVDFVGIGPMLESTTAPATYLFEGDDTNSAPGDRLRISFTPQLHTASLTLELGKPSQQTFDAENGCVEDRNIDIGPN